MRLPPEVGWVALLWAVSRSLSSPPAVVPAVMSPPAPPSGPMSLAQLIALAQSVGFPEPQTAAAIAMAESSGNPFAMHIVVTPGPGALPERSFGLWQINTLAHPEFDETQLLGAAYNAHAALLISRSGTDFTPWSTFTSGAYRRFLGASA